MRFLQIYRNSPNAFFYILGLAVFGLFVLMTVWGDDGIVHLVRLQQQRARIATENNHILMENFQLLNEIQGLKDARAMEQSARSELGLIRPNETVFVIPKN
jgi:cell division protein FtsB